MAWKTIDDYVENARHSPITSGKISKVVRLFEALVKVLEESRAKDTKPLYHTLGSIAEAQRRFNYKGHLDDAENTFAMANILAATAGDMHWHSNCLYGLGKCKISRKDYNGAIEFFKASLRINKQTDFARGKVIKNIHLSYCYSKDAYLNLGDAGKIDIAAQYLIDALDLIEKNGEKALTEDDKKMLRMKVLDILEIAEPVIGTIADSPIVKRAVEYFS